MLKAIVDPGRFPFPIHQTESPDTWKMDWLDDLPLGGTRRLLRDAETFVLQNGGERLIIASQASQENLHQAVLRFPSATISRDDDQYVLQLIIPDADGMVHDDYDFRTPLHRISCPTCVTRIIEGRTKRLKELSNQHPNQSERVQWVRDISEHSRLIGEAYLRLAQIEMQMSAAIHARKRAEPACPTAAQAR